MPVSFVWLLFPAIILAMWRMSRNIESIHAKRILRIVLVLCYAFPLDFTFVSEMYFKRLSGNGDSSAKYTLSRIVESRADFLQFWYPLPLTPDDIRAGCLLQEAAEDGYPPAMYAFGVRLNDEYQISGMKYARKDGVMFITQALSKGFVPTEAEYCYYAKYHRQWPWK